MKRIINKFSDDIFIDDLDRTSGIIIAVKDGKLFGVVAKEEKGWILRIGRTQQDGWTGYHNTLKQCLLSTIGEITFYTGEIRL